MPTAPDTDTDVGRDPEAVAHTLAEPDRHADAAADRVPDAGADAESLSDGSDADAGADSHSHPDTGADTDAHADPVPTSLSVTRTVGEPRPMAGRPSELSPERKIG